MRAIVYGFAAAFFWGTHSVIVRFLTQDLSGITIAVLRLLVAAAAIYAILRICRFPVRVPIRSGAFWLTVAGTVLNYICFHMGLERTTATNAMMLENTAPFFVIALLFLFRSERVRWIEIAASAIAVTGVYLTVRSDFAFHGERMLGDALELLAGLTWGMFIVGSCSAIRETDSTLDRLNFLFSVFACSAAILLPLALFYSFEPTAKDLGFIVILGVFPTALAYYLWYEAASDVSTVTAALLFALSILFTFVNAYVFLGEAITSDAVVGAILIVVAVLVSRVRRPDPPSDASGSA